MNPVAQCKGACFIDPEITFLLFCVLRMCGVMGGQFCHCIHSVQLSQMLEMENLISYW